MTASVDPGLRARGATKRWGVGDMLDELMIWLEQGESGLAYLALAAAAFVEYVFPPFPGDTVTLFGTFLAATRGYSAPRVFSTITLASTLGGLAPWGLGRWMARHPDRGPAFLRAPANQELLERVRRGFERWGGWYLIGNRFLPAVRAFIFVGAGLSGVSARRVLLFGGLSASLWNALLFGLGFGIGENWDRLEAVMTSYQWGTLAVAALLFVLWLSRIRRRIS